MPVGRQSIVLRHLRQAALSQDPGGRSDGDLLANFVARRDAAALEALIRRHGPMVLAVCRRVLAHEQDAEDAFQAAFLVFVRKAASIRGREQVGNWLYGVAHRTALKARTAAARRRANERRAADMPHPSTEPEAGWEELLPLLDHELSRLPDKYRAPVVLCELEGRPRKEAARQLGVPEGTLSSRLATARRMLAKRLTRYGPSPSAGALTAALMHGASAAVAPPLLSSTVQVASLVAAGQAAAGAASARVAALAEGVVKAMLLAKLSAVAIVAALVVAAVGSVAFAIRAAAEEPAPPGKAPPAAVPDKSADADKPEPKKADDEWGEAVDGVQARLRPTKTHWGAGEAADFVLDVRNKGETAHGGCRVPNFCEIEWDGKWYQFGGRGDLDCKSFSLEPGKQVDEWVKALPDIPWVQKPDPKPSDPPTIGAVVLWRLRVEPGKHTVRVGFRFDDGARPVSRPVEIEIGKESQWGRVDGGVQARVRTPKAAWKEGEAPTFHFDLRNLGTKTAHAMRIREDCEIEVDGVWYAYPNEVGQRISHPLEAGNEVNDWVTMVPDKNWVDKTPSPVGGFLLAPGKHTVRIAYELNVDKTPLRPVSGPIEIEVGKASAWGEPVDGVQARVRTAKREWKEGEAPRFSIDLRNQGKTTPNARRVPYDCQIEVDGVWYSYEIPSGPYPSVGDLLEPGKQVDDWASVAPDEHWTSLNKERTHFPLKAGQHMIRVAYSMNGEKGYIRPVSGPVEIVVGTDKGAGWGEPSEGVQARLRTMKVIWGAKETPTFILDLRNQGERTPHAMPIPFKCEIEVDGTWYHYQGLYAIKIEDKALEPGKEAEDWVEVTPTNAWVVKPAEPAAGPYPPLTLAPGKHTIRLVFPFTEESPAIRPVSGSVEIEVREDEGK